MKKMRSSEQTKRWNRKGFSLAETLVTLLILSFVMGGIVSGSSAALKVYRQARRKADAQTLLSTAILALSENLYYSKNVSYDSSFQVTGFDSETTGYRQTYANGGTDGIYIVPPEGADASSVSGASDAAGASGTSGASGISGSSGGSGDVGDSGGSGSAGLSGTSDTGFAALPRSESVPVVSAKTQVKSGLNLYASLKDGAIYYDPGHQCYYFTVEILDASDGTHQQPVVEQKAYIRSSLTTGTGDGQ